MGGLRNRDGQSVWFHSVAVLTVAVQIRCAGVAGHMQFTAWSSMKFTQRLGMMMPCRFAVIFECAFPAHSVSTSMARQMLSTWVTCGATRCNGFSVLILRVAGSSISPRGWVDMLSPLLYSAFLQKARMLHRRGVRQSGRSSLGSQVFPYTCFRYCHRMRKYRNQHGFNGFTFMTQVSIATDLGA